MTAYSEQSLFFIPVPDLKKLCSVFLSFQSFSQVDEGELRNHQVKTCREILRLYSDVVASPVLGSYGGIRVIMAISSPQRVLPNLLHTCLSYSITARLAPNWNRAGQYLIAGKDFLSDASKRIAVVMELSVNETELCVSVEVKTVRLPPITLKDFDFPSLVVERFMNNRETVLYTKTPNNWCYILPSMKRGKVISISRTLPPECPFQTFMELQNHWNSMYGYHLPSLTEDESVYCSVYFKPLGEKLFTYPLCCIRIQPVQCFPRVNLQWALTAFVSDSKTFLENVCGFKAQMTSKPSYHTTNLSRPSIQGYGALPPTLTLKSSSRPVLTQLPNVFPPERTSLSHSGTSPWPQSQPVGQSIIRHPATTNEHGIPQIPNSILQPSYCHSTETCQFPSSFSTIPSTSASSSVSASLSLLSNTVFTNKSLSCHVNITKILAEKQKQEVAQCVSTVAVKRPSCSQLNSASSSSLPGVSLPLKKKQSVTKQPTSMSEMKKNRGEVFESHPKKAKVNLQEVDVLKYARNNQLAKINSKSLQAWLKGHGIIVRSKDKKEDLMSKVMQCLNEL